MHIKKKQLHVNEIWQHKATPSVEIDEIYENCMLDASRGWDDVMHNLILEIRLLGPWGTNSLMFSFGARGGKGKRMISHVSINLEVCRNNVYSNTMA